MKNIQEGDNSHSMKRVASKAGGNQLRRQQSRADLGGSQSPNDRFNRMSSTSSFAPQGVSRHLNSSSSHDFNDASSNHKLRSLSRTASVANNGMKERKTSHSTVFGFKGNPASIHGRQSSMASSDHSKSMHKLSGLANNESSSSPQDLLSNYWSESRPRGQLPTSRSSNKSNKLNFGTTHSEEGPIMKVRSRSMVPSSL